MLLPLRHLQHFFNRAHHSACQKKVNNALTTRINKVYKSLVIPTNPLFITTNANRSVYGKTQET